jgi:hypothetical protein
MFLEWFDTGETGDNMSRDKKSHKFGGVSRNMGFAVAIASVAVWRPTSPSFYVGALQRKPLASSMRSGAQAFRRMRTRKFWA